MLKLLKILFYICFITFNIYIYNFVTSLKNQKECLCNNDWKPENLKLVAQFGIMLGVLNLILPFNKTLYSIPLISTVVSVLLLGLMFMKLFTISRYSHVLTNNNKCKKTCKTDGYEQIINLSSKLSITNILLISVGLTIILLYL